MNYAILFTRINQIGAEMISSGGNAEITPHKIKRLLLNYGYTEPVVIVSPNCLTSHAIDPKGEPVSSVCRIEFGESSFSKLNKLNNLCINIAKDLPDENSIASSFETIENKKYISIAGKYIASILGGTGFALMFGCNVYDCLTTVIACIIIVALGNALSKHRDNLFLYNAVICLVVETFILVSHNYLGICHHPDRITLGVIMLLISGLGVVDGLTSLINKDASIGIHKINNSIVGALGIAMGIAFPMVLIGLDELEGFVLHDNFVIQTVSCTIACVGFGILFCIEKKYLPFVAICSCITWLTYSFVYSIRPSIFFATVVATLVECIVAIAFSYMLKIIPSALLTVSLFPLIPGPNLFYVVYGFIIKDKALVIEQLGELFITCLAISFGYCIIKLFYNNERIKTII